MSKPPLLTALLTAGVVAYHGHNLATAPREGGRWASAAPQALADAGYVLRFEAGQLPATLFRGRPPDTEWLFLREEVATQFPARKGEIARRLAPQIASVVAHYEARGVRTVILPVPTKVSIERDRIATPIPSFSAWNTLAWAAEQEDARGNYEMVLDAGSGRAVDLFRLYEEYRSRHPGEFLYGPQDTHWTSLGMSLAAQAAVEKAGGTSPRLIASAPDTAGRLRYDLWTHLQLPPVFADSRFPWREPVFRIAERSGSTQGRLILAGTSYSARLAGSPFGLGAQIAGALRRELIDAAFPNGGMNGSFLHLVGQGFSFRKGDVLVWEIPVRFLFEPREDVLLLPIDEE